MAAWPVRDPGGVHCVQPAMLIPNTSIGLRGTSAYTKLIALDRCFESLLIQPITTFLIDVQQNG